MENEFEIMAILPEGKKNAVSSDALTGILHLKSKRELQQRIAKERKAGALILSSSTGGYYTSKDPAEVAAFVRTLENRAKQTFLALRPARKFLKEDEVVMAEFEGQISMESL